jgi:hypothetical protein
MYNRPMHRTQLYIDETLASEIQQVATIQHRSAAAVIRDAVRTYLASVKQEQSDDPFLPIIGAYTGGPADAAQQHDRYLYGNDTDSALQG